MFLRLCQENDIEIINIVRKEEQVTQLKEIGAKHILNSTAESYNEDLASVIAAVQPTAFFDCVGGEFSQKVFLALPRESQSRLYFPLTFERNS